jgi:hypothetical protein
MTPTVKEICDIVKKVGGEIKWSDYKDKTLTLYICLPPNPTTFEFIIRGTFPIAGYNLQPVDIVEELQRVLSLKKENLNNI